MYIQSNIRCNFCGKTGKHVMLSHNTVLVACSIEHLLDMLTLSKTVFRCSVELHIVDAVLNLRGWAYIPAERSAFVSLFTSIYGTDEVACFPRVWIKEVHGTQQKLHLVVRARR